MKGHHRATGLLADWPAMFTTSIMRSDVMMKFQNDNSLLSTGGVRWADAVK